MNKELFEIRAEMLSKVGFGNVPDCDVSYSFGSNVVALDTKIVVQGDHADDLAYIYYAMIEDRGEMLEGFFYAPSLLEHPLLSYQTFDISEILDEVNKQINCDGRIISCGGFYMIYISFDYYCIEYDFRLPLSDMLKVIGILDYFLSKEYKNKLNLNITKRQTSL